MKKQLTNRGFSYYEFTDHYGKSCSLQKSSLAFQDCIWLGINDANPQIMASDAIKMGLDNKGETTGHIPFEVPEQVHFDTRMHLTQEQVKELLPILKKFAKKGKI